MLKRLLLCALCLLLLMIPFASAEETPFATLKAPLCDKGQPYFFCAYKIGLNEEGETLCRIDIMRHDGVQAEPMYYTLRDPDSVMAGGFLHLIDINADGFLDLEAFCAGGASNRFCTYFVYNGKDGFAAPKEAQDLPNVVVYPRQKLLLSYEHDSAMTGITTMFRWREDGLTPYVYREALVSFDETKPDRVWASVFEYSEQDGAETELMRETIAETAGEQAHLAFMQRCNQALWQGLDATETGIE